MLISTVPGNAEQAGVMTANWRTRYLASITKSRVIRIVWLTTSRIDPALPVTHVLHIGRLWLTCHVHSAGNGRQLFDLERSDQRLAL